MKTIGILGGMSAASSQLYYSILCDLTQQRLGGLSSPQVLLRSVDFAPLASAMAEGEWGMIGDALNREAINLMNGGADFLLLATNTMHKMADEMMQGVDIPLLHIADATAAALNEAGMKSPALFATRFTIEEGFYVERLKRSGLAPQIPDKDQQAELNRIIFDELCRNEVNPASRQYYIDVLDSMARKGADSVILGCTEVCLLLNEGNASLPVFDTTYLHCKAALEKALENVPEKVPG